MRVPSRYVRPADWPERLHRFIDSRREIPFAWGQQDCGTLACDAVQMLAGIDPLASLRGSYASEDEYEAMLAPHGGLEQLACATFAAAGLPDCPPGYAQRGDVVLVEVGNQMLLGVVTDVHVAVPGADGLHFVKRAMIRRAWAV
ncbi:DUF6950 family protein [Limobrevibacterium gyesilva]|uniref:DUF6950 domain-containing protein n=1 Tax=Limobrevibacterium gyesilva TaxID=2991712 RepID=A0AA41YVW5_9PROT|nr:hypothetical protein [Limobrevibacterium gyesilva]MCW3477370.1 hypothetical protein [Limobrevibacterium gyesilva]